MKTEFTRSNKDNIATATVVAVTLFAVASGLFNSRPAVANHETDVAVQQMDTIVVSAPRFVQAARVLARPGMTPARLAWNW